jgi:uncharacterized protein YecE (DUF72 family)
LWTKFSKTLEKINQKIEFWLFKMPPSFKHTSENLYTVSSFFSNTQLKNNAVIEFRDPSWWKVIDEIENIGIVFCSVDAPDLPRTRIVTNNTIYLRIHGYKQWYQYIYSKAELDSILTSVRKQAERQYTLIIIMACSKMDFILSENSESKEKLDRMIWKHISHTIARFFNLDLLIFKIMFKKVGENPIQ